MKYLAALPFLASVATATATYNMAAEAAPTPVASGGPAVHTVMVGGMKAVSTGMAPLLAYTPESITANVGDKVKFVFMQKNHTATQSTFAEPCKAMAGGQDSGFKPNPMGMTGAEFEWEMDVTTTDPIWMYCKQRTGTHCGKGMVFSINAPTTGNKTHADFKQLAIQINGTDAGVLTPAAIQSAAPTADAAAAAPSPFTVIAGDGAPPAAAGTPPASVAAGQGLDSNGNACSCSCLCGVASFPAQAAMNNFGGFAAMFPS